LAAAEKEKEKEKTKQNKLKHLHEYLCDSKSVQVFQEQSIGGEEFFEGLATLVKKKRNYVQPSWIT